jgi:monothiol glutaredoxin
MSRLADIRQRIEALLRSNRLVLFVDGAWEAPESASSLRACHALDGCGLEYAQIDVQFDPALRDAIVTYGGLPAIPQLYLDGTPIASGDAIERMAHSGELHAALGHAALGPAAPDRTPPTVRLTQTAAQLLRRAIDNTGNDTVAEIAVDAQFRSCLRLVPRRRDAIATIVEGVPLQFDLASARRAEGLSIDCDENDIDRGGWSFVHPKAPVSKPVRAISPAEAEARVRAGTLTIVDLRPAEERAAAPLSVPFLHMDEGTHAIRNLAPDAPLACLCRRSDRGYHAAEHLRQLGHRDVYYVDGGIDAWADSVDASIPRD